MDKSIKSLVLLLITFFFTSCNSQDVEIKLTIHNKSGIALDSIRIHDVFDYRNVYYNVKSDTSIIIISKNKRARLPKGETVVFSLSAFKDNYYYNSSTGFIGFPGTKLEDKYELYIYDTYITSKKDFVPNNRDRRKKLSQYMSRE